MTRYAFEFQNRYRPMLAALGVFPGTAWVDVDDDGVHAKFGLIGAEITYDNIEYVCVSGPYLAVKAIGPRLSFADQGMTMGTTTAGGVCIKVKQPIKGLDPTGNLLHPGLTVTVVDREGFAADVRRRAGLPEPSSED